MLERINSQHELNKEREPNGYRYNDETLIKYLMSSRIQSGKRHYEWSHANFPGVYPALSVIDEKINQYYGCNESPLEGELIINPLVNYIKSKNLAPIVLIAADGTAIVGRREYCSKSDALTGFSLPLKSDGLPDAAVASASTVESMSRAFRHLSRASQEMLIMAQPFSKVGEPDPPAFRICSYGTDNKFTTENSEARLKTIVGKLKDAGIDVIAYSTDGDSRELKLMTSLLNLGNTDIRRNYF